MLWPLSEDFDTGFLLNRELIQISIGVYQVIFAFAQNLTIAVEDRFVLHEPTGETTWKPCLGCEAGRAASLLGHRTTRAVRNGSGIQLWFDRGFSLEITPTDEPCESFQINDNGRMILV